MKLEYDLTEPLKAYDYFLKDAVHEAAINYFDGLAFKNQIDIEGNQFTIKQLNALRKKIEETQNKINGKKGLKVFLIIMTVLFFIAAIVCLIVTIMNFKWWMILIILACIAAGVGFIFLIRKVAGGIKDVQAQLDKLKQKENELVNEAKTQMQPLNDDFDWNIPAKILTETIPLIKMDQHFDQNKFYYLKKKYGFMENEENISSLFVQSGSILGNPFILERNFVREIRPHTYVGTLTIHWTTVIGSGKDRRVVTHTQTLTAEVTKPRPEYFNETWLVYGNEAAPRLSFSRKPVSASAYDDKKLEKYVRDFESDVDKKVKKTAYKDKPLTLMANTEFEALFNALDRDNDVEYRLLFTPLAQKNMVNLLRSKKPYGDDFCFIKNKQLNYIKSNHMQTADIDGDPERFKNYNFDAAREYFINYIDKYFAAFYFDLAALISIPLYQQHMSFEEIFKGTVDPNLTSFETEVMANKFDESNFKHKDSTTPCILKREFVKKNGDNGDVVNIHAHSYRAVPHTEFVTKMGGDGLPHQVPVVWYEYIPLEQVTPMAVQTCETTQKKFAYNIQNQSLRDFLSRISDKGVIIYQRGLISFLLRNNVSSYDGNELNNYLQQDN